MQKQLFNIPKQQFAQIKPSSCSNINIGVLGHVDSGKTSICKILSSVISTASLDRNPQSQQRGITIDLGFSAFFTYVPFRLEKQTQAKYLQFTLVDCPGHADLIRTIIGGAQIIDRMFLIIDIVKGIQIQTVECIIIAELFIKDLIVIVNKVDLVPQRKVIQEKISKLNEVFLKTKFANKVTFIQFSTKQQPQKYALKLKQILLDQVQIPQRNINKPFLLLIDHCFLLKGKGTVVTGTIIQGKIKPNQQIEFCEIQKKSKVKSMQMFKKQLTLGKQGDRVALLMNHLQADNIERGVACLPGTLKKINKCIINLNKVKQYKLPIANKGKFHIISGHQTVMGQVRLFTSNHKQLNLNEQFQSINNFEQYSNAVQFKQEQTFIFCVIFLQREIFGNEGLKLIGYKYDIDDQKMCRIAFHGDIQVIINEANKLKLFKQKQRVGVIDRIVDNYTIIVKDLFTKQTKLDQFLNKEIIIQETKQIGKIESAFGNSGKVRVTFKNIIAGQDVAGKNVIMKYKKWYN